ncbi:MAG TPA: IS1634 family transposase [Dermatophilaceae bacterium]|nr:IS1634 family transposase [Dermatophilaceae bacterium]
MPKRGSAVHVSTHRRHYVGKDGVERDYETHLLRRSYREDGKVKNETVANLSHLPADLIEMIRASLTGEAFVPAAVVATVARTRPHGHVAAVHAQAKALGLPALLGPAGRDRDIALALIIARVCRPASKLATTRWWADTTLAADLGVADASTDEVYAAMDWLAGRQEAIEAKLVRTHLTGPANPDRLALFDLSSSWVTGKHCSLAARGYSRDGKKGLPQIEYGLLTDPAGRPVAVRVFPGNTADPTAFSAIVQAVKDTFKLTDMVMVGDRGMITSARVQELRELGGFGWVTALRAPAIAALAADDGPLQMSLFDQVNLAEITHPDYPRERLIACRNPALATERARKRLALLDATDTELAKIVAAVAAGRLADDGKIGIRVGKVVGRYKMAKHYILDITDDQFAFTRNQDQITAEAALDGIYVIRTTIGPEQMDPAKVVATYKSLARVERDFRSIKSIDLDLRPIHHWTESRVRAHVFICMLAAYLTWHLRQSWAPLTFTDEQRPDPIDPVAPARRSQGADHKAATKTTTEDLPATSFTALLGHLATLTRNHLRVAGHDESGFDLLAIPTPTQRRAFELISAPIPLTLK